MRDLRRGERRAHVLFDGVDESATACTAEIAVVPYEATVTFDSVLPGEVVVKHRADRSGIVFTERYERRRVS